MNRRSYRLKHQSAKLRQHRWTLRAGQGSAVWPHLCFHTGYSTPAFVHRTSKAQEMASKAPLLSFRCFSRPDVAKAPCYALKHQVLMFFQSSVQYFYKLQCVFILPGWEKKRIENSRKAAILRKEGIKCKRNKIKKQMKKPFFSFIRNMGNRLCSSCLGPRAALCGIQPGCATQLTK